MENTGEKLLTCAETFSVDSVLWAETFGAGVVIGYIIGKGVRTGAHSLGELSPQNIESIVAGAYVSSVPVSYGLTAFFGSRLAKGRLEDRKYPLELVHADTKDNVRQDYEVSLREIENLRFQEINRDVGFVGAVVGTLLAIGDEYLVNYVQTLMKQ